MTAQRWANLALVAKGMARDFPDACCRGRLPGTIPQRVVYEKVPTQVRLLEDFMMLVCRDLASTMLDVVEGSSLEDDELGSDGVGSSDGGRVTTNDTQVAARLDKTTLLNTVNWMFMVTQVYSVAQCIDLVDDRHLCRYLIRFRKLLSQDRTSWRQHTSCIPMPFTRSPVVSLTRLALYTGPVARAPREAQDSSRKASRKHVFALSSKSSWARK